jgi:hypothetical protein
VENIRFISNLNVSNNEAIFSKILAKIPVNSEPLGIIYYEPSYMISNKTPVAGIEHIEVKLTDDTYELIDLNGLEWEFTLHIKIEKTN